MSASIDYSSLYASSSATSYGIDASLLLAISGTGAAGGGDPLAALTTAERDQTKDVALTAKQPQIARAIAKFTAAVSGATDAKTLLKNPDVLSFLLTANGLGDQAGYTALAQKALLSDTTDPKSVANKLADTRWKSVAQTYDFAKSGLSVLKNPKVLATLTSGYAEIAWRKSLDAVTPGLSTALDFRARAATAKTADQILGDSTFRSVITTALGIPAQIAYQTLGAQENAITTHLDIKKLQDPKYVTSLTQQFLIASQASATASGSSSLEQLSVQSAGLLV